VTLVTRFEPILYPYNDNVRLGILSSSDLPNLIRDSLFLYGSGLDPKVKPGVVKIGLSRVVNFGLSHRGLGKEIKNFASDKSGIETVYEAALKQLEAGNLDEKCLAVQLEYMRHLGLRAEEARKLDALHCIREVSPEGQIYIHIVDGTKGGKKRWVPVSERAEQALERGAALQQVRGTLNLMNPKIKYEKTWTYFQYRAARAAGLAKSNGFTFHSARHMFAQELFQGVAGFDPPVKFVDNREFIHNAARVVGNEWRQRYETACRVVEKALGHGTGRADIRATYIGRI